MSNQFIFSFKKGFQLVSWIIINFIKEGLSKKVSIFTHKFILAFLSFSASLRNSKYTNKGHMLVSWQISIFQGGFCQKASIFTRRGTNASFFLSFSTSLWWISSIFLGFPGLNIATKGTTGGTLIHPCFLKFLYFFMLNQFFCYPSLNIATKDTR